MVSNHTNHSHKGAVHMKALYHKKSLTDKLKETFSEIFTNETEPTRKHLTNLMISVIALNGFQSVKYILCSISNSSKNEHLRFENEKKVAKQASLHNEYVQCR